MNTRVGFSGSGIAPSLCASLLSRSGIEVTLPVVSSRSSRVVVLPEATVDLLGELWEADIVAHVPGRQLRRRQVAWSTRELSSVDAPAFACELEALRAFAHAQLRSLSAVSFVEGADSDVVVSTRRDEMSDVALHAGQRVALEAHVEGIDVDLDSALVATVSRGWLFIAPDPRGGFWATLVLPSPPCASVSLGELMKQSLLEGCRAVSPSVGPVSVSPCAPAFEPECAGSRRAALGEAALCVDPVRGDGVGYAARGAVLLSTVLIQHLAGAPSALNHYEKRLELAFRMHLQNCHDHYTAASNAALWRAELVDGTRCLQALGETRGLAYRLLAVESPEAGLRS